MANRMHDGVFGGVFRLLPGVCLVITEIQGIEVRCRCECNSLCLVFLCVFFLFFFVFMFGTSVGMGFLQGDVLGFQTFLLRSIMRISTISIYKFLYKLFLLVKRP